MPVSSAIALSNRSQTERLRRVSPVDERRLRSGARGILVRDRSLDLVGVHSQIVSRSTCPTHKSYAVCMFRG